MIIKYIEKHPLFSIILFSLILLLPNLDVLVVTIMEARNFITAREMVEDGNWILTTMNGNPRYEKPPLPTWLTAISGMVFGMKSLFALRLPAAIMVGFSGIFMFLFVKKISKEINLSILSSFILITSFYIIVIINEAPWDIFTHGYMLASIYFLYQFFESKNSFWKNAILAGIFGGLSLMSKGPVSFYALLVPFIIAYGFVFKFKGLKDKFLPLLLYLTLMITIGGWWFLYVRMVDNETFLEVAKQETSRWGSYNVRPFYYYWSFFIQSGIWAILALIGLIYPYLIKRVTDKKLYLFSFLWTIIALILLSIIPEKKSRYLVPVLFPLALNTSLYVNYLILNFKNLKSKKETFPVYFNFGLFGVLALTIPIASYILLKDKLDGLWVQHGLFSISLIIIGIFIFKNLKEKNIKRAFYCKVAFMHTLLLFGLPMISTLYNNSNFNQISKLKNKIEPEKKIKSYAMGGLTPEMLWYYGGKIDDLTVNEVIQFPPEEKFGVLIEKRNLGLLKQFSSDYTIEFVEEFDLNYFKKKRERLKRDYYLVTKNSIFD